MARIRLNDVLKLVISLIICQLAGFIGSLFTTPAIPSWYATLVKPSFTPPNWVFAPVWTTLFLLMGISAFLVWRKGIENPRVNLALRLFIIQLILNIIWSVLFFGLRSTLLGLVEIIILWTFILFTILYFFKVSKIAGILLLPYFVWVSFAAVLNFSIWRLNP
ncbi:MAG: tryptophan-rich sensory protein [candidate division Zixibacteria bacterium]|nr:tryptophan-rich sensory protein [candidate division Zixibacteria bacterium]